MAKNNSKQSVSNSAYATPADFKQIFTEDVDSLYLLSLLLTGDPESAETCVVDGIGESTKGNHVFREWARTWARRTIVQSAIRLVDPRKASATASPTIDVARVMDKIPIVLQQEVSAILELAPLERFVFVMSVLERFSDHDCSILLGYARRDIATVRTCAVRRLVMLLGLQHDSAVITGPETVIELVIAQQFAASAWNRSLSK